MECLTNFKGNGNQMVY